MNHANAKLIVLRGPSGSGKSTVAKAVRLAQQEKMALIEQDHFRRIVLKEKDVPNGLNAELIKQTVFFALEHSYHVLLEGIFYVENYQRMFEEILNVHPENNYFFYFDIPFEETLRRHQYKPNKDDYGEKEMRAWHKPKDFLTCTKEWIVNEHSSFEETKHLILTMCQLNTADA